MSKVSCTCIFRSFIYWDYSYRLIEQCWSDSPAERPTFREIIERLTHIQNSIARKARWKVCFLSQLLPCFIQCYMMFLLFPELGTWNSHESYDIWSSIFSQHILSCICCSGASLLYSINYFSRNFISYGEALNICCYFLLDVSIMSYTTCKITCSEVQLP